MTTITFTIDNGKIDRIKNAMAWRFPIPVGVNGQPLFTKGQWAKESVRRWIIKIVADYEKKRVDAANAYIEEDNLIT